MTAIEEIEVVHPPHEKNGFWHMPKMFYTILFIEFWERFAFYGLQSVALLFFIQTFHLEEAAATHLFTSFTALLYAFLVIGGYLGDKVLGLRRTYLLGILFLMVGYGSFGFIQNSDWLYWSMGLILTGNIFFKTNAGNYVNRCFKPNDPRLDSAFTYFYMAINLGSFLSMMIIPLIAARSSFGFSISLCGVGMMIALLSYYILHKNFVDHDNEAGKRAGKKGLLMFLISGIGVIFSYGLGTLLHYPLLSKIILFSLASAVFLFFFAIRRKVRPFEQKGMSIVFILLTQSVFFWLMYMQMSTSLTLFAVHNVRTEFFGLVFPPEITQSFNPFYIFLLSPILAFLYTRSEQKGQPMTIPGKFAVGMFVCGLAYLLLAFSCFFYDDQGTISLLWLFAGYGLYSLGELLISAIGLSMVAKLMPTHLGGFAQATWFVTTALGQKFGGSVAAYAAIDNKIFHSNFEILQGYQHLFAVIGTAAILLSFILFFFVKKLSHEIAEVLIQKQKM